jgi:hypothetical protein
MAATTIPAVPLYRLVNPATQGDPSTPAEFYYTIDTSLPIPYVGAVTWTAEGAAAYVLAAPLPGTLHMQCYYTDTPGDFTYSTATTLPSSGSPVAQPPWYVFDPNFPAPPGAVPLQCWQQAYGTGYRHYYTAAPELDSLAGWTYTGDVGYVFKPLVPVYRWWDTAGYHYFSTNANASAGDGLFVEGRKFYAFGTPIPGTIPVYSYLSPNDQYLDTARELPDVGWVADPNPAFYALPPESTVPGTVPLQHYESSTSNFYTADPGSEVLWGYTYCHDVALVFPVGANGLAPDITLPIPTDSQASAMARAVRDLAAYVAAEALWQGVVVTLSSQAVNDVGTGLNISAAVVTATQGLAGGTGAAVADVVTRFLWTSGSTLSGIDQGNGVYLTVPWNALDSSNAAPARLVVATPC